MHSEDTARETRRSPRIIAQIPLDLQAIEPLAAATAVINLHGALILSAVPWASGTILILRNRKNNRSIRARVVWTGPQESSGRYKIGIEFETPESGFWGHDYNLQSNE